MDRAVFLKYEAYKDPEVEWIGEIPEDWGVFKIKYCCSINTSTLPENSSSKLSLKYVDISNVSFEKGILGYEDFLFKDAPSRARRMAKEGDTVISTVRTYLKAIAYVDKHAKKYTYSTGFAVVEPFPFMNNTFVGYLAKSDFFTNQVDIKAKGMSYPAINSSDLSNILFVIPTRKEQTLIAQFLDQKTAQIDQAIAIKEQQIELLKERKQIIIQQAVTQGLDPNVPMKDSGVEWIGQIPEHWVVRRNFTLFKEMKIAGNPGLPVLSVSIHSGVSREELTEHENIRSIIKIEDKGSYKEVQPGDIAYNMMRAWQGGIGAVYTHGMVSPAYVVARPLGDVDSEYFELLYRTASFIKHMDSYSKGITGFRKRLYWNDFRNLVTIVPPLNEQLEINKKSTAISIETTSAISKISKQVEKLREYKTTLINSAVTGKIKITPRMMEA